MCPASKTVIDSDRYRGPLASLATHNFTFVLRFSLKNAQQKGGRKDESAKFQGLNLWWVPWGAALTVLVPSEVHARI